MENNNYNLDDFSELDNLRQQINDLKNKVDQQGRLNEALVKKTIQGKMKGVHSIIFKLGIVAIACIPLYIMMKETSQTLWQIGKRNVSVMESKSII